VKDDDCLNKRLNIRPAKSPRMGNGVQESLQEDIRNKK
jgi:hypothetical protein